MTRPTAAVPTNLPHPPTAFVGRRAEMAALAASGRTARLLTLTGPAGAGKTRLARELAAARAAEGPEAVADGVWWVALAPLAPGAPAAALWALVADVLGVQAVAGGEPGAAVARALSGRRLLLVLDNCEHVVDAAAAVAERLVRDCPSVAVLATSRERLRAEAELAWPVPPLARPPAAPAGAVVRAADLQGFDAVRLFVARAAAALPGFALSDADAPGVRELCTRLDGLPLAIELAVAALPALGLATLVARLDDALVVLDAGATAGPPHHRTLSAVLDWSARLLTPDERRLLGRLAVFRGDFALAAAEAVGGALPGGAPVLDALCRLVEHSLVEVRGADAAAPRYALLETVRQYGAGLLRAAGDEAVTRARHAAWIAQRAESVEPAYWTGARQRVVAELRRELDDVRAALAWAVAPDGDALLAVRIAAALGWVWSTGLAWEEGRRAFDAALAAGARARLGDASRPPAVRLAVVRAGYQAAYLANYVGDAAAALDGVDALAPLLDGLAVDARTDPDAGRWVPLLQRAQAAVHDVRAESRARLGDVAGALASSEAALADARRLGHPWFLAALRARRAAVLAAAARPDEARAEYAASASAMRALGDGWMEAFCLHGLAREALASGRPDDAARHAVAGVAALGTPADPWLASRALDVLAAACVARARATAAATLAGAAEALRRRGGSGLHDADRALHASTQAAILRAIGADAAVAAGARGAALTLEAALAVGAPAGPPETPPPGEPAVALRLLGTFAMRRGAAWVRDDALPAGKVRELLLWLALHDGGTKERVGLDLWPDASPGQLRSSFHFTLHRLRGALGAGAWVTCTDGIYRLVRARDDGATLASDVHAVEEAASALRRGVAAPSLDAVRDALGPGQAPLAVDPGAGAPPGEWLARARHRLRGTWVDAMARLGARFAEVGRHGDATDALRAALTVEPLREELHRELLRAYLALGEPARALAHYDALVALLRREVGMAPARETAAVIAALRPSG